MTDGEALLKAIIAQPGEDTPRLVYADWLDENGDPELAALIRVADPHAQRRSRHWNRHARRLVCPPLPRSKTVWVAPYPCWPTPASCPDRPTTWSAGAGGMLNYREVLVGLRYGFASAVGATTGVLAKYLPALVRAQPVHEVAVIGHFFESSYFVQRNSPHGDRDSPSRAIRRRADRIPAGVFSRLSPPPAPCLGGDVMCAYPDGMALHDDLGRAFLAWAAKGSNTLPEHTTEAAHPLGYTVWRREQKPRARWKRIAVVGTHAEAIELATGSADFHIAPIRTAELLEAERETCRKRTTGGSPK